MEVALHNRQNRVDRLSCLSQRELVWAALTHPASNALRAKHARRTGSSAAEAVKERRRTIMLFAWSQHRCNPSAASPCCTGQQFGVKPSSVWLPNRRFLTAQTSKLHVAESKQVDRAVLCPGCAHWQQMDGTNRPCISHNMSPGIPPFPTAGSRSCTPILPAAQNGRGGGDHGQVRFRARVENFN